MHVGENSPVDGLSPGFFMGGKWGKFQEGGNNSFHSASAPPLPANIFNKPETGGGVPLLL